MFSHVLAIEFCFFWTFHSMISAFMLYVIFQFTRYLTRDYVVLGGHNSLL